MSLPTLDASELSTLLSKAEAVVRRVMKYAREARVEAARTKSHQDFVTNIDHAADRFLEEGLSDLLPDCPVLSEERAVSQRGFLERYWIVDPIDGTLNMMANLPFYGIAVCLVDMDGPLLSLVGGVAQDDLYVAIRGMGAYKNGRQLVLDANNDPPDLIVPSTGLIDRMITEAPEVYTRLREIGKIRNFGAQALHLVRVAEGSFAAVASIEAKIWDEAAAGLVLREAGGVWISVADNANWACPAMLMGQKEQRSIAAHPAVIEAMRSALAKLFQLNSADCWEAAGNHQEDG